ncbi:uncharacterized protein LOC123306343 [Coccinella septempunctata]|uniref:uncharacterized protein LOC123306343 n=1 Tax=Coccinella septempunctata TaxID=41139 RepID=UPI001D08F4E1|nr:uncharacterized protein LOC123306343 [Coccinella septempunctata]
MKRTITALKIADINIYTWSDSKVVLAWLQKTPNKQNVFIVNRVNEVHRLLGQVQWNYVKSEENPADLLSRGALPSKLQKNTLWWNGPAWLKTSSSEIKRTEGIPKEIVMNNEEFQEITVFTTKTNGPLELLTKFSSWKKTKRVMAYCKRFIDNCRSRNATELPKKRAPPFITPTELQWAKTTLIKLVQNEHFQEELTRLNNNLTIKKTDHLKNLDPYIDEEGVLRVGGRLQNSSLSFNQRHPIILPTKCHLTDIIIRNAHYETLHGGTQLTLSQVRQEYWIPHGKNKIKHIIRSCVICTRYRSTPCVQKMGNLPRERVNPSHPFTNVGIDYAGPIQMRLSRGRGSKSFKGYISIFVCLATKAIHLEAVSDLSTEAFMAAFRRFTSRRGLCSAIFSDNGTNFIGAKRILDKEYQEAINESSIEKALAEKSIKWHRIPPGSPHFGGLWEAGVKSTKFHLRRIVGDHKLTFEEMSTLLCQIEACLNSRPLIPITENPQELDVLTPGHFLIGKSLHSIPEPEINEKNITLQDRWRLIQKTKQDFWKKWTSEYLSRLQQRSKWTDKKENMKIGDIVLVKQDNVNPNYWPLGRVTQCHPGNDGFVRVATIRCKDGKEIRRPITKICILPVEQEERRNDKTNKVGPTPDVSTHS